MKIDQKYIWDYDTQSADLNKPEVLRWYISRKISVGDWDSLEANLVKKNLNQLSINPTLKRMLKKYYAQKSPTNNS